MNSVAPGLNHLSPAAPSLHGIRLGFFLSLDLYQGLGVKYVQANKLACTCAVKVQVKSLASLSLIYVVQLHV